MCNRLQWIGFQLHLIDPAINVSNYFETKIANFTIQISATHLIKIDVQFYEIHSCYNDNSKVIKKTKMFLKCVTRTRFWWGNLREGDHRGDPGVDGRIILGWIFGKWDVGVWTGWS
jgi:hypothetical protein